MPTQLGNALLYAIIFVNHVWQPLPLRGRRTIAETHRLAAWIVRWTNEAC